MGELYMHIKFWEALALCIKYISLSKGILNYPVSSLTNETNGDI